MNTTAVKGRRVINSAGVAQYVNAGFNFFCGHHGKWMHELTLGPND